ncbi:MAG: hypothetical protein FJ030_11215 [Chloroflexi bacterium]|nr:hypothetical protein [Chloroflexota bacterium]
MKTIVAILLIAVAITACGGTALPTTAAPGGETASPTSAPSPTTEPSPTPVPLAAAVNGQPILLSDYEIEVARYEAGATGLGRDLTQEGDYRAKVLEALINEALMLQAAQAAGVTVADSDAQTLYDEIVAERGGQAAFEAWLAVNLYTPEQFRAELRDGMIANAMQSQVAASVPLDAEQTHARHILVATKEEADTILAELSAGADFATLAVSRSLDASRINGGDLGWFPASGLTQPEVAQAAFALQSEEISPPVQSALGFHIVQTLERGVRPLSASARALLQKQAVEAWKADLRSKAAIERFVP